jgi:UPF0755 protein
MKGKIFLSAIILLLALWAIGAGSYFFVQNKISNPLNSEISEKKNFVIKRGDGVKQIAFNLEKEGIISGKDFFEIYVWQKKAAGNLQAGEYELSPSMTIPEIVELFIRGKIKFNEVLVTIPEGFSNDDIDKRLSENGLIKRMEFLDFDKNPSLDLSKYEFLQDKPNEIGLQGYYFPDTYRYYNNSSAESIAEKMLDNFDKKLLPSLRKEIKKQGKSVFEIIVLASIIEKEAKFSEDMKKIAGVFQNRLNAGKPLESDATINYITGSGRARSTFEDLQIDSPYNTYRYSGLPPGPISNPGIEAIKAAIYPEKSDYFYFLTKEDGKAVFSKTYQEHLRNKNKYLN